MNHSRTKIVWSGIKKRPKLGITDRYLHILNRQSFYWSELIDLLWSATLKLLWHLRRIVEQNSRESGWFCLQMGNYNVGYEGQKTWKFIWIFKRISWNTFEIEMEIRLTTWGGGGHFFFQDCLCFYYESICFF